MLSGIYENSIDAKNRIVVPQELRSQIVNENGEVWLTYSPDACVRIYSCEVYASLVEKIAKAQSEGRDTRAMQILFIKPARKVVLDGGGRVFLSSDMRDRAKIVTDASEGKIETAVVGNIDHLEIWLKAELNAQTQAITEEMGFNELRSIGLT